MGSSASKTASKAASTTSRRAYPSRSTTAPELTKARPATLNPTSNPATSSPPQQDSSKLSAATEAFQSISARRGPSPTQQTTRQGGPDPRFDEPETRPGPRVHTSAQPSESRNEAIDLDARDPVFATRLSQLGPVTPFPQYSPSSTAGASISASASLSTRDGAPASATSTGIFPSPSSNPAIAILTARTNIAEAAEREKAMVGRRGFEGRMFMDVATLRKVLVARDEGGVGEEEIEKRAGLRRGSVRGLGRVGVVEAA